MRGPSSSHCAAALRIGRLARDLMGADFQEVLVEFDRNGSLPTTHESQGSDMGLFGGLLGGTLRMSACPVRRELCGKRALPSGLRPWTLATSIRILTGSRCATRGANSTPLIAISTGGGMMEVINLDGFAVCLFGDYHETLLSVIGNGADLVSA